MRASPNAATAPSNGISTAESGPEILCHHAARSSAVRRLAASRASIERLRVMMSSPSALTFWIAICAGVTPFATTAAGSVSDLIRTASNREGCSIRQPGLAKVAWSPRSISRIRPAESRS